MCKAFPKSFRKAPVHIEHELDTCPWAAPNTCVAPAAGSARTHRCRHRQEKLTKFCCEFAPCLAFKAGSPSTVLAQDRFFSDFLSFTLDKQDPQSHHDDVAVCGLQDSLQLMLRT